MRILFAALACLISVNVAGQSIIAAGYSHSLALKDDGTVTAWGANTHGQCDIPNGLTGVVSIASGYNHSLALKDDGTVVAWGSRNNRQCNVPSELIDVVSIAAGPNQSLALKDDGTVVAWGTNSFGVCDVPNGLTGVVSIASGNLHSLALKDDGTVVVWGTNGNVLDVPNGLTGVVSIASGSYHALALKDDGTVVAWGDNRNGQCNVPSGLTDVVSIAAGDAHSLALKDDGTVVALGSNHKGQCDVPSGLTDVVSIAAGDAHSLALKDDGTVVAWGANWYGLVCDVPDGLSIILDFMQFNRSKDSQELYEYLSSSIKTNVEHEMNKWQEKGEFEKLAAYQNRVNEKSINDKIISLQNETIDYYNSRLSEWFKKNVSNTRFTTLNLYDAENETFKIDFKTLGSIVLEVPIDEAQLFKSNFDPSNFEIIDFAITSDQYVIANIIYKDDSNTYRYLISNDYKYITTEFNYEFNQLDLNLSQTVTEGNITIGTELIKNSSNKEIKFQVSDSTFSINSVAVIPKEIKECNGNVSSADELASFTETNILSHYNVTDRRHLEAILEEQRLQMTGLTFEKTLIEFGCIENAQAYLFVQSGCLMGDEMIEIRLVHCETSNLVWSCTGINASPQEVLARINEELSKE